MMILCERISPLADAMFSHGFNMYSLEQGQSTCGIHATIGKGNLCVWQMEIREGTGSMVADRVGSVKQNKKSGSGRGSEWHARRAQGLFCGTPELESCRVYQRKIQTEVERGGLGLGESQRLHKQEFVSR